MVRAVLVVLAIATAIVAAVPTAAVAVRADPEPGPSPAGAPVPGGPKRLLVVSDSTLAGVPVNGALDDLRAALPGWEVTYDARAYRNTAQGVDVTAAHGPAGFDAVVVGLGNNDGWSSDNFSAQMARMLEVLAPVPNVYWLTVREIPRFQQSYQRVNAVIRLRATAGPHVEVADWNRFGAEHPEAFYDDGLHLTPAGAMEMAQFLASVVKRQSPYLEPEDPPPGPAPQAAPGSAASDTGPSPGTTPATAPVVRSQPVAAVDGGPSDGLVAVTIGAILLVAAAGIAVSRALAVRSTGKRGPDPSAARP